MSKKIIFASSNLGKLREINSIFAQKDIDARVVSQSECAVSSVEETASSFVENALIKARHACKQTGLPSMADDSGIVVPALDGRPGIYSARYAGLDADDQANYGLLLKELSDCADVDRRAYFICIIVFLLHDKDPVPLICQGKWYGYIASQARGTNGFGYDPIFFIPSHQCTAAELALAEKNQISHRRQALDLFFEQFKLESL